MSTQDRILDTALTLFNNKGIASVSMRAVAAGARMSVGNLTYHFPNRDSLVQGLLNRLIKELNAKIEETPQPKLWLELIWEALLNSYQIQQRYQFIMLDLVHMLRKYPTILEQFRQNYDHRRQEYSFILQALVQVGELMSEPESGHYDRYILPQLYCISDFWLSEAALLYKGPEDEKAAYYARMCMALLYPYLTEKGRRSWRELFKEPTGSL
ncbi:TetR/AcrR family transcriptional regulator [Cesiribacter sp. SM1]|uniref:TetR/AcrR family transcriptional regulator n=1 Tax=Cesiribacter sp. SM1 TaxID=2861196 RepID=UPI001CD4C245|nr:TetR/AcrR family transcriptional regulator [Cesiribacter sp. SM1]